MIELGRSTGTVLVPEYSEVTTLWHCTNTFIIIIIIIVVVVVVVVTGRLLDMLSTGSNSGIKLLTV